jgi:SP family xylose:H+ symportor-like MFS transporter
MARPNAYVTTATLVAAIGGLLFGYDTAVISGAVSAIDVNFVDPWRLSETARDSLSGFTVSSALLGCVIGGAAAGWVGHVLGRKRGMLLAALLFLISAIGSAAPELGFAAVGHMGPAALAPFITYRVLCGLGVGLASMLSPLYIAEVSPPAERGRHVAYYQMAIVIGIVVVYFVNWAIARQGDDAWLNAWGWRWMLGSEAAPALLFLGLLLAVPETPRWLTMKGRTEAARAVLLRLVDQAHVETLLVDIRSSFETRSSRLFAFGAAVVVIGIALSVFQQLVGINAVLYYAPTIFKAMGFSTDSAFLQTVIVGAVNMVFTLVAIFTVDRWGRKPLLIAGALVMAGAMFTLGGLFSANQFGPVALLAMLIYTAGFSMSWGPVVWVLLSEMFPNSIRNKAMAIAVAAQWIANLFVSASFKVLDGAAALNARFHHGFPYLAYGAASLAAALFVLRFIPETKGRGLETIETLWGAAKPAKAAGVG